MSSLAVPEMWVLFGVGLALAGLPVDAAIAVPIVCLVGIYKLDQRPRRKFLNERVKALPEAKVRTDD